jgi:hypothetical protein
MGLALADVHKINFLIRMLMELQQALKFTFKSWFFEFWIIFGLSTKKLDLSRQCYLRFDLSIEELMEINYFKMQVRN